MEQIQKSFVDATNVEKYDAVYLNTPYNKLSVEELAALPIADLCKPDATLFLWADTFTVAAATDLITKYGFTFKSVASILNLAEKPAAPAPAPAVVKQEEEEQPAETTVTDVTGPEAVDTAVPTPSVAKPRGPRVKSIQPPSWWGTAEAVISRPTTELLLVATRGAGAPLNSKYKPNPYQVSDMPELAKSKARGRQPASWCTAEWFFRRPADFLESAVHSIAADSRIIELFGDTLHDTVHSLSPGVPLGYVPALSSEEGVVGVAKTALDNEGKVALRSLAAKLRRLLNASAAVSPSEDGEVLEEPPKVDDTVKAALDKAHVADQQDWSDSLDLKRIFSSCADYKLANHSSRSRKHKRTQRSKTNADGTPVKRYGIAAPSPISEELCAFLGEAPGTEIARTSVVQRLNTYIKENNLKAGRIIKLDQKLQELLKPEPGQDVTFFSVCRLVSPHILKRPKPEGAAEEEPKAAKKAKKAVAAAAAVAAE